MTTILPCPFCGVAPRLRIRRDSWGNAQYRIECMSVRCVANPTTTPCDSKGMNRSKSSVIEAWNTRPVTA